MKINAKLTNQPHLNFGSMVKRRALKIMSPSAVIQSPGKANKAQVEH